jgi:hypothetical protein
VVLGNVNTKSMIKYGENHGMYSSVFVQTERFQKVVSLHILHIIFEFNIFPHTLQESLLNIYLS